MWFVSNLLKSVVVSGALLSVFVYAEEEVEPAPAPPVYADAAELFGIPFNNLSKATFERHLRKMGLEPYPSYRAGVASYSLGKDGILGIKELTVVYNDSKFVEQAMLSGVVESNELRSHLGNVLLKKYGAPDIGFVRDGFGRARWNLRDGTEIELHNTTFDVSVIYIDTTPHHTRNSGKIDVEALMKRSHQ